MNKLTTIIRAVRTCHMKYPRYSTLPAEVVAFTDKDTIVCWHPEQPFPYEYTLPIPKELLQKPESSDTVLKIGEKEIAEVFRHKKKYMVIEELAKLTYTTKHQWYPRSRDKRAKKTLPDRPYL